MARRCGFVGSGLDQGVQIKPPAGLTPPISRKVPEVRRAEIASFALNALSFVLLVNGCLSIIFLKAFPADIPARLVRHLRPRPYA
jgi:hypothetical protein